MEKNTDVAGSVSGHGFRVCCSRKLISETKRSDFLLINIMKLYCFCLFRCTKIINADSEDPKYIINVKQFAKFVVDLSDQVAPTDIEEGMRVGYETKRRKNHYDIIPRMFL